MRTLIVSDIHSNLAALEAVVAEAERGGRIDATWCLGDGVGYGPQPMECLRLLWDLGARCIQGNHDAGAIGLVSLEEFVPVAGIALHWTGAQLTEEARRFLRDLPLTLVEGPFTLVHGTPATPLWEYLVRYDQAQEAWRAVETTAVLVGHSHVQFVCAEGRGITQPRLREAVVGVGDQKIVVNPGSVGQPRDGDPRAAYALWDDVSCTLTLARVGYDLERTQHSMRSVGLPGSLAARLSFGR